MLGTEAHTGSKPGSSGMVFCPARSGRIENVWVGTAGLPGVLTAAAQAVTEFCWGQMQVKQLHLNTSKQQQQLIFLRISRNFKRRTDASSKISTGQTLEEEDKAE